MTSVKPIGVKSPSFRALMMRARNSSRSRGPQIAERIQIVDREFLAAERRRIGRKWLRRPRLLARDVGLRGHGPFLDRPDRLAGDAIEDVQKPRLAGHRHDIDVAPVVPDRRELWRRRVVVVPEIVMHVLEMPQPLARSRVEREQAVGKEIRANPIGAVEIVRARSGGKVRNAARGIDRDLAPRVRAADVLPRVLWPGVVPELTGMRHCVKLPHEFAGDDVVGAEIAGRRQVAFAGRRPEQDEILENLARRVGLYAADRRRIAAEPLPQIDRAVDAEREDRFAGGGVELLQVVAETENQAPILAVLAFPVVDAPAREALEPLVNPDLGACRGVDREQRVVAALAVDDAARDDRVEARLAVWIVPRDLELADVRFVDLLRRDEVRIVGTAGVVHPGLPRLIGRRETGRHGQRGDCGHPGQGPCRHGEKPTPVAAASPRRSAGVISAPPHQGEIDGPS